MTTARKILFYFIALLLIPLIFFALLESVLRLSGYGYPTRFFVSKEINRQKVYLANWEFGKRFFSPQMYREPLPVFFPAEKGKDVYRIFILGESAAMGDPRAQYGFWRILEVLLRERYPQVRFEIINTAMTGINSHVLYAITQDCVRHQPDLFVIYAGNNEAVGPFGAGTVFSPVTPRLWMIRSSLGAKDLRIGQFVEDTIHWGFLNRQAAASWKGMSMIHQVVPLDDPWLQRGYRHFKQNLRDICETAAKAGARVIVSTVAANLKDCAPFASTHRRDLTEIEEVEWNSHYERGLVLEEQGKTVEALAAFRKAEALDDRYAALQYRLARILYKNGEFETSGDRYQKALELDALRFRADSKINEIIREVSQQYTASGAQVVDFEKHIRKKSANELPGERTFYDHVHLKFLGNYQLASLVADECAKALPASLVSEGTPANSRLTMNECAKRLAYTEWDQINILGDISKRLGEPPFAYQLDQEESLERLNQGIRRLTNRSREEVVADSTAMYEAALASAHGDPYLRFGYAQLLTEDDRHAEAASQYEWLCRYNPYEPQFWNQWAQSLAEQKKYEEALSQIEEALRLRPGDKDTVFEKGKILSQAGKTEEAIRILLELLQQHPEHNYSHLQVALLLGNKGEWEKSIEHLQSALQINPNSETVYNYLGIAFGKLKRYEEAAQAFREALEINPDFEEGKINLQKAEEYIQGGGG